MGFANLLPRFGWQPWVLTVKRSRDVNLEGVVEEGSNAEEVRTRELNLDGLIEFLQGAGNRVCELFGGELRDRFFRERLALPDGQIAWLSWPTGVRLARQCSVVYASCSPYSSALSGCVVKRMTGRPLVVDLRDAWSLNPHAHHEKFHQRVIERLEKWVFECADHIILNTEGARRLYEKRYGEWAFKMSVVPNGYDQLNIAGRDEPVREPFRIMHVGAFYGSRTPDQLLAALSKFDGNIEFVQVGPPHPALQKYRGTAKIVMIDQVRHHEALALMRTASLLYLRQGWEPNVSDYIAVAAKTYEYLATGLPILAHCPPGDNADLIRRYATAAYLVTSPDGTELDAALRSAYDNRFGFVPQVDEEFAAAFDRERLTAQLAQIFDTVTKATPAHPKVQA
jgi:glycosyltransferase involved in cell wall biosynthesis